MFKQYRLKNYNFFLIICLVGLSVFGILIIGSAKESVQNKQIMGFVLGFLLMIAVSMIDYTWLLHFSWLLYVVTVGLLILVKTAIGTTTNGSQRWIRIGSLQFQPSELSKIFLIVFFAAFLMKNRERINQVRTLLLIILLAVIPLALIFTQPDTSTTIVLIFILAVLLYLAGLSYKIIFGVIGTALPVVLITIVYLVRNAQQLIADGHYQVKRIMSWLDPTNSLYSDSATQQQNSIMAIASGQIFGKGLNNTSATSMKNSHYIIEPQTDFIYAVAGEETGFIGSVIIVGLLFAIVMICIFIGRRAKDLAGQLICFGMASLIAFQTFVNLSVATGLMPNTGIPLPFVSYGLTSLVSLYLGMGLVLNIGLQPRKNKGGSFI